MCRWTLLHCKRACVRKSLPYMLGSIAVNFIGESHAVHRGPWFAHRACVVPVGRERCRLSVTDDNRW
jgi:hypothetical protein